MKPDVTPLRGAVIHDRCPGCMSWTEGDKCPLGCPVKRCAETGCKALYIGGHECPETCDRCPEPVNPDARCTHGRALCPECLTACPECRDEFNDDARLSR